MSEINVPRCKDCRFFHKTRHQCSFHGLPVSDENQLLCATFERKGAEVGMHPRYCQQAHDIVRMARALVYEKLVVYGPKETDTRTEYCFRDCVTDNREEAERRALEWLSEEADFFEEIGKEKR